MACKLSLNQGVNQKEPKEQRKVVFFCQQSASTDSGCVCVCEGVCVCVSCVCLKTVVCESRAQQDVEDLKVTVSCYAENMCRAKDAKTAL